VGLAMTILLSYAKFLTLVSSSIPVLLTNLYYIPDLPFFHCMQS
jgi:hypothetical protein